jgi:hypothetical protein
VTQVDVENYVAQLKNHQDTLEITADVEDATRLAAAIEFPVVDWSESIFPMAFELSHLPAWTYPQDQVDLIIGEYVDGDAVPELSTVLIQKSSECAS